MNKKIINKLKCISTALSLMAMTANGVEANTRLSFKNYEDINIKTEVKDKIIVQKELFFLIQNTNKKSLKNKT